MKKKLKNGYKFIGYIERWARNSREKAFKALQSRSTRI